jgi:hypothetical protein
MVHVSFPAEVVAMKSSVSIGDYLIQQLYSHGVLGAGHGMVIETEE